MANYETTVRARPAGKGKWEVVRLGPFPGRDYIETLFTGSEEEATALAASLNGPVATPAQQAAAEANQTEPVKTDSTEPQPAAEVPAAEVQDETETSPEAIPTEGTTAARKRR